MEDAWGYLSGSQYRRQSRPVIANTYQYRDGDRQAWHSHEQLQFIFTTRGVLRVVTSGGAWTLGPNRGLFITSRMGHELSAIGETHMHSIYIEPEAWLADHDKCRILLVSPLLRELTLAMVKERRQKIYHRSEFIVPLMLQELGESQEIRDGCLPLPGDRRLQKICQSLIAAPANGETLRAWGERIGASDRTLSRLFVEQTGLTFGQWRQQLRLVEAIARLAKGLPVAMIAAELGYRSASSFITMFKRVMGETPQNYLKSQ